MDEMLYYMCLLSESGLLAHGGSCLHDTNVVIGETWLDVENESLLIGDLISITE